MIKVTGKPFSLVKIESSFEDYMERIQKAMGEKKKATKFQKELMNRLLFELKNRHKVLMHELDLEIKEKSEVTPTKG